MSAEQFFQNNEYSYLNKFTKYDMVKFAEEYHEIAKRRLLYGFVKWVIEQPPGVLKTDIRQLIEIFLNQNDGNTQQNQEALPENQG